MFMSVYSLRTRALGSARCALHFFFMLGLIGAHPFGARASDLETLPVKYSRKLNVTGVLRDYLYFLPDSYDEAVPAPVILALHGSTSYPTANVAVTNLHREATKYGFVTVFLHGWKNLWAVQAEGKMDPNAPDDVLYANAVIQDLSSFLSIDTSHLYATGFSGGARTASKLGCELSPPLAGMAAVGGVRRGEPCSRRRPLPVLAFHGVADPVNPFAGGGSAYWGTGVIEHVCRWALHNGCGSRLVAEQVREAEHRAMRGQFTDCRAPVEVYFTEGEGHTWPGGKDLASGALGEHEAVLPATHLIVQRFLSLTREHPSRGPLVTSAAPAEALASVQECSGLLARALQTFEAPPRPPPAAGGSPPPTATPAMPPLGNATAAARLVPPDLVLNITITPAGGFAAAVGVAAVMGVRALVVRHRRIQALQAYHRLGPAPQMELAQV